MKKNSRNLDYLIGTLWFNKYDSNTIKMAVDIEYIEDHNRVKLETLNGPHAGMHASVHEIDFFNYHKEIK
jgi:hypothetical protein